MKNIKNINVPAGEYWVGDPCYPFPNEGPKAKLWEKLLENKGNDYFKHGYATLPKQGIKVWAFHPETFEEFEGIVSDSGLIGAVPVSVVNYLGIDQDWLKGCGNFVTLTNDTPLDLAVYYTA